MKKVTATLIKSFVNPPMIGLFLGGLVAVVPALNGLFIGSTAPLYPVASMISSLGAATIPCSSLILAGNLYGTVSQGVTTLLKILKPARRTSNTLDGHRHDGLKGEAIDNTTRVRDDPNLFPVDINSATHSSDQELVVISMVSIPDKKEHAKSENDASPIQGEIVKPKQLPNEIETSNIMHPIPSSVDTININCTTEDRMTSTQRKEDTIVAWVLLLIRLVLVPAVSFAIIHLSSFGSGGELLFLFILLIEGGMPTAMSTPMMFQQLNRTEAAQPLAFALILQYTLSVISLTALVSCSLFYAANRQ